MTLSQNSPLVLSQNVWTRIKRERLLYRYNRSGQYFARVPFRGKLHRRKLDTGDLDLAKRKLLRDSKNDLERKHGSELMRLVSGRRVGQIQREKGASKCQNT